MVQQVVVLLHLVRGKLTTNEKNVGQTLRLVNITKDLPHLRGFFATFDVRKLVVYQIEVDDEHDFFHASLVLF